MTDLGFLLFETPIGVCGIVWGDRGVVGVRLPEASASAARARIRREFPDAHESPAPPDVQHALEGIVALLSGEAKDLAQTRLAIEALKAIVPVLEGSAPPEALNDFKQVLANLQLAYADATKV